MSLSNLAPVTQAALAKLSASEAKRYGAASQLVEDAAKRRDELAAKLKDKLATAKRSRSAGHAKGGWFYVDQKSLCIFTFKHSKDKVMITRTSSPVSAVAAAAADAFHRAAGTELSKDKGYNFENEAQAQLAVVIESGVLLDAGKIMVCSGEGCVRFVKAVKTVVPVCFDCKEASERKYSGARLKPSGKWESTVWVPSKHYNHYVGTFDGEAETAAKADAYILANGIEGAKLSFESPEAAAAAVAAEAAA